MSVAKQIPSLQVSQVEAAVVNLAHRAVIRTLEGAAAEGVSLCDHASKLVDEFSLDGKAELSKLRADLVKFVDTPPAAPAAASSTPAA